MALLLKKSTLYYRESTSDPWTPFVMSADANFMAFADEYSASATYAVGEYCRYDGDFWRCTTAIPTAEAWNSAHWQKTTIGAELDSIKVAINNKGRMYTTEPLTTLYANVASDEFEVFSASATMTSQLTAGNYSGLSYGFAVFHPQNNLVEVLTMATGASKIYTCRITSDGTVSYTCDVGVTAVTSGKVLYYTGVAVTAGTGDIVNYSNAAITNEHVLAECVFANPIEITTDVTWTTTAGNLRLNGTCSSATTVNVVLIKRDN